MLAPSLLSLLMVASQVTVTVSPWTAQCHGLENGGAAKCDVPKAAGVAPEPFAMKLAEVSEPGQAGSVIQDFKSAEVQGRVTIFSVDPVATSGLPPYLQIQLEITAPVRALCVESVRVQDKMEIPPMICAGYTGDAEWGVTSLFQAAL